MSAYWQRFVIFWPVDSEAEVTRPLRHGWGPATPWVGQVSKRGRPEDRLVVQESSQESKIFDAVTVHCRPMIS
jgi:hypothetical protein